MNLRTLLTSVAALGLVAACADGPVAPPTSDPLQPSFARGGAGASVVPLEQTSPGVSGTTTLRRRNGGFSFQAKVSGLMPHHPVTLWIIDPSGAEGRGAAGVVSGSGKVTLAGNNCLDVLPPGKSPGTPPSCDHVDPAGPILMVLLQGSSVWVPGDQSSRWSPAGKPLAGLAFHIP